ncbi:MAG: hypothetical protein HKN19_03520 [Halioglobus sp.]|nr:hypothetical protein [Halioglobus sp.]
MRKLIRQLIILCLPLALPAVAEQAPADAAEAKSKRCLSMSRISDAQVIDDQTIAFHMTGRDIYLNELPRRCPGMHFGRAIGYRTHAGQLCNLDTITVIDSFSGVHRGPTCGLGHFKLISKDELKALKAERRKGKEKSKSKEQEEAEAAPE